MANESNAPTTPAAPTRPTASQPVPGATGPVPIASNPGEYLLAADPVEINAGRRTTKLIVRNTGDRASQIGSHFHFFEVNRALDFDRDRAMGMRLNIPAGTTIRFEPGDEREVELVEMGGTKRAVGFNALVMGSVTGKWSVKQAIDRAIALEFRGAAPSE